MEGIGEGLLYVEVECPPELELEFHAWYNLEHVPERLRIPGFLSGHRYVALEGGPRWLAAYGLESPGVLESPEYRQWMGPLQTPWTRRMVSSTRVRRSVFRCVHRVGQKDVGDTRGLLAVRYASAPSDSLRLDAWHDRVFSPEMAQIPGVVQASHHADLETSERLALYHLADPWVSQQPGFAGAWTAGWERERGGLASWKRTLYIRIL
ncbi:MAG TPA: hypothetical protein VLT62_11155 [Candidatus Methylomirabilis sp.]|nr:hypothetical protein [Candidatus Methylomirabilis sp.]